MLAIDLLPPPANYTVPPLVDESSLLPPTVGFFRISHTANHRVPRIPPPTLLLPASSEPNAIMLAGALRSLFGWQSALSVHLIGYARGIAHLLRAAAPSVRPSGVGGDTLRALRQHRFSACAMRLHEAYVRALERRAPDCARATIVATVLRLLAPALLPQSSFVIAIDPLALFMDAPHRLFEQLRLSSRRRDHTGRVRCARAANLWASGGGAAGGDDAIIGIDVQCAASAGWLAAALSELRTFMAAPAIATCPRFRLLDEVASVQRASADNTESKLEEEVSDGVGEMATVEKAVDALDDTFDERDTSMAMRLGCEWSYQPVAHAVMGQHRLVTLHSEGIALYTGCMHTVVHQAFAAQWRRAHGALYSGTNCGCGQRVRVLLPPRDESGELLSALMPLLGGVHPQSELHGELVRRIHAQLPSLLVDGTAPVIEWWARWASLPDAVVRWMRFRVLSRLATPGVLVMANRLRDERGETMLVMPRQPAPMNAGDLSRLRSSSSGDATPLIFPCGWAGAEEAWLPDVLFGGCATRRVCLSELIAEATAGRHAAGAAAFVPGAIVVVQSQQLRMVLALARLYCVASRDLILVHISDGNIWEARVSATARIYAHWRHAFRQYGLPDHSGALAASAARGEYEWFPIGMNPQWVGRMPSIASGELHVPRASERRHLISFLGSTDKSDRARRIALVDGAIRGLSVRSMSRIPLASASVYHRAGNVACYGTGCADERYVHETLDSALCLSLPGSSVESNRLYEGLEGGCVPLIVESFGPGEAAVGTTPTYGESAVEAVRAAFASLANVTGMPPPFLVVKHAEELPAALAGLAASSDALDEMQRRSREWWSQAKAYYAGRFERACRAVR